MKRTLASLLLLVALCFNIFALTGCNLGNKNDADNVDLSGGYDGSEVTITFYHTMGENLRTVLDSYIAEFNKIYPNITIEHQQVGGYDDVRDQISTEITVGNQPNIAYCYPDHVAMYNLAQATLTLDDLIASTFEVERADGSKEIMGLTAEQIADFIPGYYNEGKAFGDGKMYTMPLSKSTEVLFYNKTYFAENGLTVPTTWDEMEAVCARILEIEGAKGNKNVIPLGYDSEANWFITMCEQYGSDYTSATGDHFLFNNETNIGFVTKFAEWYNKGYVTTKALNGDLYTSKLFVATGTDTKSYMCIGSTGGAKNQRPISGTEEIKDEAGNVIETKNIYAFDVGIAPIPQVNPDAPKAISQGPSLCIFKKSNAQEVYASWLFVKYLTTNVNFQAEFSMVSGYSPVIKSVSQNEYYANWLSKADGGDYLEALSTKVCLEQENAYYVSPAFNGSSEARDQVGLLMQKCFDQCWDKDAEGKKTTINMDMIKKAFQDAVDECEYQAG